MNAFWFFAGVAAYYKLDEARLANEKSRDDAIEQLQLRAQSFQDELEAMESDLIADPAKHSERALKAAQKRADRAQAALLLALASGG